MQSSCMTLTRQLVEVTRQNCEMIIGKNVCCCQSCNIHLECKLCPLSYLPTTPCLQSIHVTAFEKNMYSNEIIAQWIMILQLSKTKEMR